MSFCAIMLVSSMGFRLYSSLFCTRARAMNVRRVSRYLYAKIENKLLTHKESVIFVCRIVRILVL